MTLEAAETRGVPLFRCTLSALYKTSREQPQRNVALACNGGIRAEPSYRTVLLHPLGPRARLVMPTTESFVQDSEWLSGLRWTRSTPGALRKAASSDPLEFARLYACRLARSAQRRPAAQATRRHFDTRESPYLWGISRLDLPAASIELLEELHRVRGVTGVGPVRRIAQSWLASPDKPRRPVCLTSSLESLAWCEVLPRIAAKLTPQQFLTLFRRLLTAAAGASHELARVKKGARDDTWLTTICGDRPDQGRRGSALHAASLEAELAWSFSLRFPELKLSREYQPGARRFLGDLILLATDSQGVPRAEALPVLPPLIASLVRCRGLGARARRSAWRTPADSRFRRLLKQACRVARPDGSAGFQSIDGPLSTSRNGDFRQPGARQRPRRGARHRSLRLAEIVQQGMRLCDLRPSKRVGRAVTDSLHSETGRLTVMRGTGAAKTDWLGAAWNDPAGYLELLCKSQQVLAGPRKIQVQVDGTPVTGCDDYQVTCWFSEPDLDYLELRCQLGGNVVIERQAVFSRTDHFALLADAILAPAGRRVDVQATLSLPSGLRVEAGRFARDCWIRNGRRLARLVPLWLPQLRTESALGGLEQRDRDLILRAAGAGRRLYLPLFLDWHPRRSRRSAEWRSLTVSEGRRVVPSETAAGFRVRLGNDQWLLYRSLARRAVRALLGHQTRHQFMFGSFDRNGDVDPLVEIA